MYKNEAALKKRSKDLVRQEIEKADKNMQVEGLTDKESETKSEEIRHV